MFKVRDLKNWQDWPHSQARDGSWWPSRPCEGPYIYRVRDAWEVLMGRAEAIQFPDQESSHVE